MGRLSIADQAKVDRIINVFRELRRAVSGNGENMSVSDAMLMETARKIVEAS